MKTVSQRILSIRRRAVVVCGENRSADRIRVRKSPDLGDVNQAGTSDMSIDMSIDMWIDLQNVISVESAYPRMP